MTNVPFKCFITFALLLPCVDALGGIVVDYSDDLANENFFGTNTLAKAALEAAIADINNVLNLNLNAITNDVIMGTASDGSTANFDFRYSYSNPSTGATETINNTVLSANEIRIFAGVRNLTGSTLGQAGPGGSGISGSGTSFGNFSDAVADAVANEQHSRGEGPVMSTLSGTIGGIAYSFNVGATVGNLWFDQDTDNDGTADNTTTLNQNWHFDHTTAVAAGKSDFYSVALHETLHAIGVGTSDTWDNLVSGNDWLGAETNALNGGSGAGLIDGGGGHFAAGTMSTTIFGGVAQEVAMDPNILVGTRKFLTEMDVAVLRDLGFSTTTAVPEPTSLLLVAIGGIGLAARRRRTKSDFACFKSETQ